MFFSFYGTIQNVSWDKLKCLMGYNYNMSKWDTHFEDYYKNHYDKKIQLMIFAEEKKLNYGAFRKAHNRKFGVIDFKNPNPFNGTKKEMSHGTKDETKTIIKKKKIEEPKIEKMSHETENDLSHGTNGNQILIPEIKNLKDFLVWCEKNKATNEYAAYFIRVTDHPKKPYNSSIEKIITIILEANYWSKLN